MKMFHSVDRPLVIRGLMEKFASENQEIAHQSLSFPIKLLISWEFPCPGSTFMCVRPSVHPTYVFISLLIRLFGFSCLYMLFTYIFKQIYEVDLEILVRIVHQSVI